jgi:hypothetical protein
MICFAKPVLTEDLCVVQKEEFFNNMLYVRNVYLRKAKHVHKRQTHLLVRENVTLGLLPEVVVVGVKGLDAKRNRLAVNREA